MQNRLQFILKALKRNGANSNNPLRRVNLHVTSPLQDHHEKHSEIGPNISSQRSNQQVFLQIPGEKIKFFYLIRKVIKHHRDLVR